MRSALSSKEINVPSSAFTRQALAPAHQPPEGGTSNRHWLFARPMTPHAMRAPESAAGRTQVGCAAIAEFMNMKTMIAGCQAGDLCLHLYAIGDFGKCDRAAHLVAAGGMKHRNCF